MNKLRVGVIVEYKSYYGVVVEEDERRNRTKPYMEYAVEWFDKDSHLRHAWWEEKELNFVIDPTTEYRRKKEYTLTIWVFDEEEEIIKCKNKFEIDESLADLEEENNFYVDSCDIDEFEYEFKENDNYLEYPIFDNESDDQVGYITIEW